jgi:hypothetical protein
MRFFMPYKSWIMTGLIVAGVSLAAIFYGNCRSNAAHLENAYAQVKSLRTDLQLARIGLDVRNDRIKSINARHKAELQNARDLLQQSLAMAAAIRAERDEIREDLKISQFELLEAIRDDEIMADWVDWPVPSSAWSLLRNAAEGRNTLPGTEP